MKKILIFCLSYYPNPTSGAEAAVKEITDRMDPNEFEFHMVTLRYNSEIPKIEKVGNVLVHRIGIAKKNPSFESLGRLPLHLNKPLFQFAAAKKALQLNRHHRYDAIWAMMAHSAGVPAAIFKMFHKDIPYILTLQEGDPPEHIERVMRPLSPLFKRAFTTADIVQSISKFLADWARRRGYRGPLEIIRNGANPRDLKAEHSDSEIEVLRRELGKKPGDIFLVNTARLVHQKGFDTTLRALPLLPANVKFLIVGDGPERATLETLAADLGVKARVIFAGQVDRSLVSKYRRAADIFVGPSRSEGLGNAFLSAMASRLPVVATQEGGLADFLFDKEKNPNQTPTGWAVGKNNPEDIAAAVKDIVSNPEKVKKIVNNARELVIREYDWDKIAEQMKSKVFGRFG